MTALYVILNRSSTNKIVSINILLYFNLLRLLKKITNVDNYLIPRSNILDTEQCSNKNAPLEIHYMQCFVSITHNIHLLNEYVECILNIADGVSHEGTALEFGECSL
jgi:hypothetical protein